MTPAMAIPEVLWTPPPGEPSAMDRYRRHVNETFKQNLVTTQDLQRWSVQSPHDFWIDLYGWLKLTPPLPENITKAYDDTVPMSSVPAFFPGLGINYAENALFANADDDAIALIGLRDDTDLSATAGDTLTWREFRRQVQLTASALRQCNVRQGDVVAALVSTSIWSMVLFHAAASIGSIFTSIDPSLGIEGCISRLQQVTPSILFADSHTVYKGRTSSTKDKLREILRSLEPRPSVFVVPVDREDTCYPTTDDFLGKAIPSEELTFTRVPFNFPLLICYSSGTTGAPKCIVHQHGLIIQLKKISVVHNSTTSQDVILQYSSTSWVVFYIMCGYFACGATTIVYNGSPMFPDKSQMLRLMQKYRVTYFGTSPRYLLELEMAKIAPKAEFDLSSLRIVYTTGAHLSAAQYKWFYGAWPPRIALCNTAGGTDVATSLIAADACAPIHAGEMQIFALGMDVDIADPESGDSILSSGEPGEMVVRQPFPSMPCFFWGDRDGTAYKSSYFERFTNIDVWAQHDWLQCNPATGGLIMHGRSDGVLNPSGVRFGSGEIYSIVEAPPFTDHVLNSLCVGRRRASDRDEDVFLFLVMLPGRKLTEDLTEAIQRAIQKGLSPRHVPRFVLEVPDIPTTINGKKVESAVKQIISGRDVKPSNTVQNPTALQYFTRFRSVERKRPLAKL